MQSETDCLILGGGVAGTALAFLLHRQQQRVVLVDAGTARLSGPYETLLPPARTLLARTGLAEPIDACAERDTLRHGAIWGSDAIEWRTGDEHGLLLRRGAFDRALRARAAAIGVQVFEASRASRDGDAWLVAAPAATRTVRAARVAVAIGRSSQALHAPCAGDPPRAVAFTFVGRADASDRGTAVVEALPTGWVWTHAPGDGDASAVVVVGAEEVRDTGRDEFLARMLADSRGPARRMHERRLLGATDASSRLAAPEPGRLVLGDAAATIDPLASQGVEKALAAADHAAAVLATARENPAWWERLCAAHHRWERGLLLAHREVARAWYAREPRFAAQPFWRQQHAAPAPAEPDAAATFEVSRALREAPVLVREGARFVERPGFADARTGNEATHVGYVPVAPLLRAFEPPCTLAAATARAGRDASLFVLPPRAVHGAMLELARRGWLTPAASATDSR